MRGYFEIGVVRGKCPENVGTLWRSAYQLGAAGIFTVGKRYPAQASDTYKTWRHVPLREHESVADFLAHGIPIDCEPVVVEIGGVSLPLFKHSERTIYILGAEDNGVPEAILSKDYRRISIPALSRESYNVAVAGSLVMYDRFVKEIRH